MAEFKTIGEVAESLNIEPHVIRYWETQFSIIKPVKRRGGRRYYQVSDIENIDKIRNLLHIKGYTIKGAKKALNQAFMAKVKPDNDTIDMFGLPPAIEEIAAEPKKKSKTHSAEKSTSAGIDKQAIIKVLNSLKEIQKILTT